MRILHRPVPAVSHLVRKPQIERPQQASQREPKLGPRQLDADAAVAADTEGLQGEKSISGAGGQEALREEGVGVVEVGGLAVRRVLVVGNEGLGYSC